MTGDPRLRDRLAWALTTRIPAVRRIRCWWADRQGRPGFRPQDYR